MRNQESDRRSGRKSGELGAFLTLNGESPPYLLRVFFLSRVARTQPSLARRSLVAERLLLLLLAGEKV